MTTRTKGRLTQKDRSGPTERSLKLPDFSKSGQSSDKPNSPEEQRLDEAIREDVRLWRHRRVRREEGLQSTPLQEQQVRSLREQHPGVGESVLRLIAFHFYGEGRS